MPVKIISGIIGVVLLIAYVGPVVVRLREAALVVIVLIGLVMMFIDLWQSLQSKDE
jgi:hypothetical protein